MHTEYSPNVRADSPAWQWAVKLCFVSSLGAMFFGISLAPVDVWVRGYFAMGTLFLVGATLMLSKTVRDQFEAERQALQAARKQ